MESAEILRGNEMESAEILRDIIRCNKTITALDVSKNTFGEMNGAIEMGWMVTQPF
jgi:hypothetical protein